MSDNGRLTLEEVRNRIVETRRMRLGDIAHNPHNWRSHPDGQRKSFRGVVREIGWAGVPLVYHSERTGTLTYVDGHMRKEELSDLEADVAITDLNDAEADYLLATYDPISAMAEADREALGALLSGVQSSDAAVQEMLAGLAEREGVLFGGNGQPKEDPGPQLDRAAELQEKWQCRVGDLWVIPSLSVPGGEHRVVCGDCTDKAVVERVMGGEKTQSVVTDPPYGIGWDTDYTRFTTEYGTQRVKHIAIANDDKEFDPLPYLNFDKVVLWGANWYCRNIPLGSWLVWDKRHPNGTAWLSDAELAWMKGKRGVYIYAETVQGAHRQERAMHPTQKPVGLISWCIQKAEIDGLVYDPFLGSGTTLVACERLGRLGRGIEIEHKYVAVTLERLTGLGLTPRRLE